MDLQNILKTYKRQTNKTNQDIAKAIGVNTSTVARWVNGDIKRIRPDALERLVNLLGVDPDDYNYRTVAFDRPILGEVKAGYGLLADENICGFEAVSEDDYRLGDFFLEVRGDSMKDAHINEGDLLFVKQCSDVPSGSIAVFLIGGEEITVKKLIKKDRFWILQACNSEVEPRVYTMEEVATTPVQIVGKALYSKTLL